MLSKLEHWAKGTGIRRLELTVMTHNERAVGLYKRIGFEVEGLRKDSLYVDGRYVDEYSMAKLLG
jgi:RimJ/RimL family protein N-acetyltransferase